MADGIVNLFVAMYQLISFPVKMRSGAIFMSLLLICMCLEAQKVAKIEILNANVLEYNERIGGKAKRLIGNVQLKHEEALMYCDSAYVYSETNTMDALGHVRIVQGDSLQLFGDSLSYDGNTRKAELRGNNRLVNKNIILTTGYLDYDRTTDVVYYYGGGKMVNKKENNILESERGYYYASSKTFYFKNDVSLTNPEYTIVSDTLKYNSASEVAYFLGPTTITSESNSIYCEEGWHNTIENTSKFFDNTTISADGRIVEGDTIYYDRNLGYGEITCNAIVNDSSQNIIMHGDVVHFFEKKDSVMVTQEALLMQLFDRDTMFMHADTFKVFQAIKTLESKVDTHNVLLAYNQVKFFKKDLQGKADTMLYSMSDSIIHLIHDPIIWSQQNQLTAKSIDISTQKNGLDAIYMEEDAFITSKIDTAVNNHFNQIKGEKITGFFKNDTLHKIEVNRKAKTIYFAQDENDRYIGVNKAQGKNMLIFVENNALVSITFIDSPEATMYPLFEPSPQELIMKGFEWRWEERPSDPSDVF